MQSAAEILTTLRSALKIITKASNVITTLGK